MWIIFGGENFAGQISEGKFRGGKIRCKNFGRQISVDKLQWTNFCGQIPMSEFRWANFDGQISGGPKFREQFLMDKFG